MRIDTKHPLARYAQVTLGASFDTPAPPPPQGGHMKAEKARAYAAPATRDTPFAKALWPTPTTTLFAGEKHEQSDSQEAH